METPLYYRNLPYKAQPLKKRLCALSIATVAFSFYGWSLETLFFAVKFCEFCDRGLLTLPLCPMYGLTALGIYAILRTPQSGRWKAFYEKGRTKKARALRLALCLLSYVLLTAALATLVELSTALFYHKAYGVRLWNYYLKNCNYKGYISLRYSLIWGVLAALSMAFIWRPLIHALVRLPENILYSLAVLLMTTLILDFTFNSAYLHCHGRRLLVETPTRRA